MSEVGIYKRKQENKKKKEHTLSTKKATKKTITKNHRDAQPLPWLFR